MQPLALCRTRPCAPHPAPPSRRAPRRASAAPMRAAAAPAAGPAGAPVDPGDHWARVLESMPGSPGRWHARLGEYAKHHGADLLAPETGAILHVWRAEEPPPRRGGGTDGGGADGGRLGGAAATDAAAEGRATGGAVPGGVRVSYFTAAAAPGAAGGGDARMLEPGAHGGPGGAGGGGGGAAAALPWLVWDQARLGAVASKPFTFSPDSPVLRLDADSPPSGPPPGPAAPPRLVPLGGGALAIAAASLPAAGAWGEGLAGAVPPGSFWFLEVVLQHADAAGAPQLTTFSLAYDWATARPSGHRLYWQRATELRQQPAAAEGAQGAGGGEGFDRLVVRAVEAPPPRTEDPSIDALLRRGAAAGRGGARFSLPPGGRLARAALPARPLPPLAAAPAHLAAAAAGHGAVVAFEFFAADGPRGVVRCAIEYGGQQGVGDGGAALPLLGVSLEAFEGAD
ncbi:hypothetical protein Rsub_04402 [Raphidocelis subcapitata]|uniref:Uncharacterized protein n=1 Tax=Raphidocelis subcapitata TaxID=307507 RepID=A0A2V0P4P4_9CHLO|nr:hypothetical protein Rsub_04402 [Raphidocelis subcapitata]|eukprot:GBF92055.1 hypothetical protein Rsub_04402 [Raphidocelis subcapitata]